ncbi:superoxide dismutase protein [Rutstroemia sp. NJR-2017a WRK4]|nr:superoxide dismutase protein [Rutstroemia sp. NJR-2017a WRK4]
MHSTAILTVFATTLLSLVNGQTTTDPVTGTLGNASVVENNPPKVVYVATLPTTEFFNPKDPRGNVKGSVTAQANANGIGITIDVKFSNLPTSGGPFLYHLHDQPVPADGNCTSTLGHLDPFIRGETPACNSSLPQTCQVGDLSGKHGKITSDPFTATYADDFASTTPGLGSFFGNRSIVVHFGNKTRITCANFMLAAATNATQMNATATGTPVQYTGLGGAGSVGVERGMMVLVVMGLVGVFVL